MSILNRLFQHCSGSAVSKHQRSQAFLALASSILVVFVALALGQHDWSLHVVPYLAPMALIFSMWMFSKSNSHNEETEKSTPVSLLLMIVLFFVASIAAGFATRSIADFQLTFKAQDPDQILAVLFVLTAWAFASARPFVALFGISGLFVFSSAGGVEFLLSSTWVPFFKSLTVNLAVLYVASSLWVLCLHAYERSPQLRKMLHT